MEPLISTLVWAAIIQGLFLSGLYLFSRRHRNLANRLLGLFLLSIVIEATLNFLPIDNVFGYPWTLFMFPEVKLFFPVLFLHYVLEKVGRSSNYRLYLRLQYLTAFAVAGITLVNFCLIIGAGAQLGYFLGNDTLEALFMGQQYLAFLLILLNISLALFEVNHYKKVVKNEYSNQDMLQISWLWQFIFSLFPVILLWGANLVWILWGGRNNDSFELATWALVIVFIYFVSYQAFRQKNLFEGVPARAGLLDDEPKNVKLTAILGGEEEALIRKIGQHMEAEEPFLDATLSMYQLAQQLNIPVRDLSLLINHRLNKHFFDFVNEYRIRKAMEILSKPENSKMTVLEVLYEVGFNSKSSFNTVFKKFTGKTPTQFRMQQQ